jgi:hypothetical protein
MVSINAFAVSVLIIVAYDIYINKFCASGNIDPKPGMSHYIPCLIAE